ncbi:MAG: hypothetical protein FWE12_02080 [Oscillospiraceae bacterium]|nr:hypothetical protein [Oscillospiraceae bacterium]
MDMVMTLILGGTLLITLVPMYFFFANNRLPKKNIILGVTVPYAHHNAPEIGAVGAVYLNRLRLVTAVSAVFGLSMFFLPFWSIQIFILMTVLLFFILGTGLVFIQANRALAALKQQSGWQDERKTVPSMADLKAMEEKSRPMPRLAFLLPALVAAIPLAPMVQQIIAGTFEGGQVLGYVVTVIWIPLFFVLGEAIRRQNAEIVGTVSDFNVILTRIRRREYLRMMVLSAWLLAVCGLGIWFITAVSEFLFLGVICALALVVVAYSFKAEFAVRRAQEKFTQLVGDTLAVDDDQYWLWGMFYFNKNDSRILMKDRIGMNMTMNLGRPIGMICMALSGILLLAMPLIGVWAIAQEFSPIRYEVEGNTVIVTHVTTRRFDLGDNFTSELISTLPGGTRTMGTSIGTFRSGHFQLAGGIGSAFLLLHTDETPFVVLRTEAGQTLIFNFDPVFEPLLRESLQPSVRYCGS